MKKYFAKSKELLATGEDDDVIYACLELRKCLECYAYETLKFYLKEVPLKAVESWQPDKVVRELVAIDSTVNYTAVVTMRSADADEAGPPLFVGTDRRIPADYLRKIYNALGNVLHVPTIRQLERGARTAEEARKRANEVSEVVAELVKPGITAYFAKGLHHFTCHDCGAPIARRAEFLLQGKTAECGNCGLPYDVEVLEDEKVWIEPREVRWQCPKCNEPRKIWANKAVNGADVTCPECKLPTTIRVIPQTYVSYDSGAVGDLVPPAPR